MLQLLRYLIYLNVVVSLSTGVFTAGFSHFIGLTESYLYYGFFGFFATFAVYNGQRLFKVAEAKTNWMLWVRKNAKYIQAVTIASAALAAFFFLLLFTFYNSFTVIYVMLASALISVFYVAKLNGKNLRELPFIKVHLIALTWVIVLVVVPILRHDIINFLDVFIMCLAHYCYVIAVTIPFDIRDLKYDLPTQKTIPQLFGIQGAKVLSLLLLALYCILMFVIGAPLFESPMFYLAIITQAALIMGMHSDRSDLYCAGAIDGAIALLGIAYFMC